MNLRTGTTHVPFSLVLVNAATLELSAELQPSTSYILSVNANNDLRDGFGLPLQVRARCCCAPGRGYPRGCGQAGVGWG